MAATKGRQRRQPGASGDVTLYGKVSTDVMGILDAGAAALGWSRVAYLEELLRRMPVDERSVPTWLHDLVDQQGQLPLPVTEREDRHNAAA